MLPKAIEGFTRTLGAPIDISEDECQPLAIRDELGLLSNEMWSEWKPTEEELEALNQGGSVFLKVCGAAHPMVWLAAAMEFKEGEAKARAEAISAEVENPQTQAGRTALALQHVIADLRENNGCSSHPELTYEALEALRSAIVMQDDMVKRLAGRQALV